MPDEEDRLISRSALQAWLGVNRSTVQRWQAAGYGPTPIKLGKNVVRYRYRDVVAFLASREVTP